MRRHPASAASPSQAVIQGGRLYWPGRPGGPPETLMDDAPSSLERLRNNVVLLIVFLYLLFNWGFQQVRIPPVAGGGVPVGEIVLILALITINHPRTLARIGHVVPILPFAIWWAFGIGRALFDASVYGSWALRDAVHVMESLFLIVGFVFAGHPSTFEKFFEWLPRFLVIAVAYGLLFPFRESIWTMSPTIMAGSGIEVPILGSMATTPFLIILAAVYLLLFHSRSTLANMIAVLLLGYTLVMFQARTLYLVLIGVFAFLAFHRRSTLGNLGVLIYIGGLLLALIALLGVQIQGRLGEEFTLDFLIQHFLAIFGSSSTEYEGVAAAAEGVDQRLEWWSNIVERLLSNPFYMLMGLGYGVPLTDFHGDSGALVREPHNSYVTVLARTGIIGIVVWAIMMLSLLRAWHRTFRHTVALGWREGQNRLLLLVTFFISMWVLALGEDGFEKPYNIIPFYFFWGIVLRMSVMLERGEIGPEAERLRRDEDWE